MNLYEKNFNNQSKYLKILQEEEISQFSTYKSLEKNKEFRKPFNIQKGDNMTMKTN